MLNRSRSSALWSVFFRYIKFLSGTFPTTPRMYEQCCTCRLISDGRFRRPNEGKCMPFVSRHRRREQICVVVVCMPCMCMYCSLCALFISDNGRASAASVICLNRLQTAFCLGSPACLPCSASNWYLFMPGKTR